MFLEGGPSHRFLRSYVDGLKKAVSAAASADGHFPIFRFRQTSLFRKEFYMPAFLRQLKTQMIYLVVWCLLPFSLLFFTLNFLLFHLASLRRAEVLILPEKLNFGGTVCVPDYARHRFSGQHLVFVTFREPTHNPYMPVIWHDIKDVEYINLRRFVLDFYFRGRRAVIPHRRAHDPAARWILVHLARWLGKDPVLLTYYKIYTGFRPHEDYDKDLEAMLARNPRDPSAYMWRINLRYGMYFHLQREVPLKQPSLPQELCAKVERALARVRGVRAEVRLCGFYIKKRTIDGPDGTSHFLDGSPFEAYLPAIRFLVSRGYQVLLTGDQPMSRQVAEDFDGMVVDGETLGINPYLHSIYTALHTDIFVGDIGGGTLFAGLVTDRQKLGLNAYLFYSAFNNFWIYYKHAYDRDGIHLSFSDITTGKYAFSGAPDGFTVESNSENEMLEAVRCYVEEMENPGSSEIDNTLEDMWPSYSTFKLANCHISPAYVRDHYHKLSFPE